MICPERKKRAPKKHSPVPKDRVKRNGEGCFGCLQSAVNPARSAVGKQRRSLSGCRLDAGRLCRKGGKCGWEGRRPSDLLADRLTAAARRFPLSKGRLQKLCKSRTKLCSGHWIFPFHPHFFCAKYPVDGTVELCYNKSMTGTKNKGGGKNASRVQNAFFPLFSFLCSITVFLFLQRCRFLLRAFTAVKEVSAGFAGKSRARQAAA